MTTLVGKCGPTGRPGRPADKAATQLEAYERVTRAVHTRSLRAPAFWLSEEQLSALFAPRQLDSLVVRPLRRDDLSC